MAAHKSSSTSERLAPLAIISSVRFSAANRDSACDGVVLFRPCLDSDPPGCTTLEASLSCVSWSSLSRDSGELVIFSILVPASDTFSYDTTQGQCFPNLTGPAKDVRQTEDRCLV